jgi:hypothetical protein
VLIATSVEIRDHLVDVLRLDLVGPEPGGEHAEEILLTGPSRWYLTGFLVPYEAPEGQQSDGTALDLVDLNLGRVRPMARRSPRRRRCAAVTLRQGRSQSNSK